ncbi:MAG: hypothetical protein RDU76_06270 [Candidatus Edwardsbacteria bacterium]|nr:hypothetical protein [Candidatus Edwardsbacteria bacterium]
MAYTTADLYTNFRTDSGEGDDNPTDTDILLYINRAYSGAKSILKRLYPECAGLMSTAAKETNQDLAAATCKYAVTDASKILALGYIKLKYGANDDYLVIPASRIIQRPIEENDKLAIAATCENPAVGYDSGNLYIHPQPSDAVTDGLVVGALYNQDPISDGDSLAVSDIIADLVVAEAIRLFYKAEKEWEGEKAQRAEVEELIFSLKKSQPGKRAMIPLGPGGTGGNLSGYSGSF